MADKRRGSRQAELFDGAELCRRRGHLGEELACAWLEQRGHRVLERNLRRRQCGEVDLLSETGRVLHVVEVKTGRAPLEELAGRVDERKLRLLLRTLARSGWLDGRGHDDCQVDLLLIRLSESGPCYLFLEDLCPPELKWESGTDD